MRYTLGTVKDIHLYSVKLIRTHLTRKKIITKMETSQVLYKLLFILLGFLFLFFFFKNSLFAKFVT